MCRILKVSESGYYRWIKNRDKSTKRQLLSVSIRGIISEHPDNDNYGIDRIYTALSNKGIITSRRTVYRTMKECGLLHKCRKPHGITKATTEIQNKENIIKRDFTAGKPLTKLLTDITEVQCFDGKLYISPVLDCFNGEIIALEMQSNMRKELCIDTVKSLGKLTNAVIHSDRGSQYTSEEYRKTLNKQGLIQSLSGTGHCYDNARMESFFATLKKEKLYRIPAYKMTRDEVKSVVFRYIFGYYNTVRITGTNPYGLPPSVYRQLAMARAA